MAGMAAPIIFVGSFLVQGLFRGDYNPLAMYISALSLGEYGWLQIASFITLGLLLLIFSFGVIRRFPTGKAARAGPVILILSALCFIFSGPFIMDPQGTPITQASAHGLVHSILGAIVFLLMPITCFIYYRRFRSDQAWKAMSSWTLIAGILISAALAVFSVISKNPDLERSFSAVLGLLQRSVIIPYMIWLFTLALALYKKAD